MKQLNKIGLILMAGGVLLLAGFALYKIIEDTLYQANIPLVVILGVIGVVLGIIIIFISLIAERVKDKKEE